MNQDINHSGQPQHECNEISIAAMPPVFVHDHITHSYQQGRFPNRLEAELADILSDVQLDEEPGAAHSTSPTDVALVALKHLDCIALIQAGQVLPLVEFEHLSMPKTALEQAVLYHSIARMLLESVIAVLEEREDGQ